MSVFTDNIIPYGQRYQLDLEENGQLSFHKIVHVMDEWDFFKTYDLLTSDIANTNGFNAVPILREILNVIHYKIRQHEPYYFWVTVEDDKRYRIYKRFIQKLINPSEYSVLEDDGVFHFYRV